MVVFWHGTENSGLCEMAKKVLNEALARAIDLADGQSALAEKISKRQGDIWSWLYRTGVVPTEYLIPIEKAVNGKITIRELASGHIKEAAR